MSVAAHLDTLHQKHSQLKKEIQSAQAHHAPDDELQRLKKQKLRIKDEIKQFDELISKESNDN